MRNYEKFFTPPEVVHRLCAIADIKRPDWVLEPHAGRGDIAEIIKKDYTSNIWCVEINEKYKSDLKNITPFVRIGDFLSEPFFMKFDTCIANPPFGNGIDLVRHFRKIKYHVKNGGNIVMIVPFDFIPECESFTTWELENWSSNSDGTTTPIKIISFTNH